MSSSIQSSIDKLNKANSEWNVILTPEQYAVLFKAATERPYSHKLNDEKREGTFICAACQLPLFDSAAKYESRTGWPSFTQPIHGNVEEKRDFKLILPRTEYHCRRCGGHQGHVFNDGPQPTGKRWCNNGISLDFIPADEPLPELRR
ncbi:MAG: peptide-methionine (R)-S-oxide reductase MsrB [Chloroflexi bacterium]|nr:peptide-methionine (R)-S-oxide reductase MsrB [Chloroflexota bacterium]